MFKELSRREALAALASSLAITLALLLWALKWTAAPSYPDFIAGQLAWHGQSKFQDLVAIPVAGAGLLLWLHLVTRLMLRLRSQSGPAGAEELEAQLLWWSLPALAAVSGSLLDTRADPDLFALSAAGLLPVVLVAAVNARRGEASGAAAVGSALLGVLFVALVPLVLVQVGARFPDVGQDWVSARAPLRAARVLAGAGLLGVLLLGCLAPRRLQQWAPRVLWGGQLALPLLFVSLYPVQFVAADGGVMRYATGRGLVLLVGALVLLGLWDVLRRGKRLRLVEGAQRSWGALLSPLALGAFLLAIKFGATRQPLVSPDDYHFGEAMLGWWSYLQGKLPYLDYVPAHGFIDDDLGGFLAYVFHDGTAAAYFESERLGLALLTLVAFLCLLGFTGSIGLAFTALLLFGGKSAWLFLVPFLCLWLSGSLRARPMRWFSVWILTAPLLILGLPPQGLLLVAASGLVALGCAWTAWRQPEARREWKLLAASALLALLLLGVTPAGRMLFGALRYVLENGPINQIAYGLPWSLSWAERPLVVELVRMSWVAVPIAAAFLALEGLRARPLQPAAVLSVLPVLVILAFSLLFIPYSMGRIDPEGLSRSGLVSALGWTVLLPILLAPRGTTRHRTVALVVLVVAAAQNFSSPSLSPLTTATRGRVPMGELRDAPGAGMKNLGRVGVEPKHWAELTRLRQLLDARLAPGESYLDLSNHNARYFYFDRPPPLAVTAPYNLASTRQQQRELERLAQVEPAVALLDADNLLYDGIPLSLRVPLIYRYVLEHYVPVWEDGVVLGLRRGRPGAEVQTSLRLALSDVSDGEWERGVHRTQAAVRVKEPLPLAGVSASSELLLPGGERRQVRAVKQDTLWLSGPVLAAGALEPSRQVVVSTAPELRQELSLALLERSFSMPDLGKLPVAWGHSLPSLQKRMERVAVLDPDPAATVQLMREGERYRVTGNDAQLVLDLSATPVSGRTAGLLRFDLSCANRKARPRFKVYWWGDAATGPSELSSLGFEGAEGTLLVPLDASPRWVTLERVRGLRIDVESSALCESFSLRNLELYQRSALTAPAR